jgi:hypothetical protein
MARAKRLKFTGRYDANGQPDRWFSGIPARDLDEREVKQLSDEDYATITGGDSPLYVDAEPRKAAPKVAAKKPAAPARKAAPKTAPSAPVAPVEPVPDAPPESAEAVPAP